MNIALTTSTALLLVLGGCSGAGGSTDPNGQATIIATGDVAGIRDGRTDLRVGQSMTVGLPSNATTGYQWAVYGMEGGILTEGTPFGQEVTDAHAPGMVGVGGTTWWRFVAERPGSATLTFTYARQWERGTSPAETAVYRVTVR